MILYVNARPYLSSHQSYNSCSTCSMRAPLEHACTSTSNTHHDQIKIPFMIFRGHFQLRRSKSLISEECHNVLSCPQMLTSWQQRIHQKMAATRHSYSQSSKSKNFITNLTITAAPLSGYLRRFYTVDNHLKQTEIHNSHGEISTPLHLATICASAIFFCWELHSYRVMEIAQCADSKSLSDRKYADSVLTSGSSSGVIPAGTTSSQCLTIYSRALPTSQYERWRK